MVLLIICFQAEGLGMGAELAAGENQNLNDADFTCSLFRFLQLTCEGHNLGDFQRSPLCIDFVRNFAAAVRAGSIQMSKLGFFYSRARFFRISKLFAHTTGAYHQC